MIIGLLIIVKRAQLKKQTHNEIPVDQKMLRKNRRIACIKFVIVFALVLASFYPFEGAFIRFNSPEASLNYSKNDNISRENIILEDEKCYFIYSRKSNNSSFHSVSKYGEKVGMVDYNSKQKHLGTNIYDNHPIHCQAVYDKNSNSSCYFVTYLLPDEEKYDVLIDGKEAQCIYQSPNALNVYALMIDGAFKENIAVTVDGEELPIMSQTEFMFSQIS